MSIFSSLVLLFLRVENSRCQAMGEKYSTSDHISSNFNDKHSYVVGIPVSPSTLYMDRPIDNRTVQPPNELAVRRKHTTSFQITSVTVQGSRLNNEDFEDSADDFDESHTDDISSDILDSSRITEHDGYHSEDTSNTNGEDLSPCGPIIIAQLPTNANEHPINLGLNIGVQPSFTPNTTSSCMAVATNSVENVVSAQVPHLNPLPDNWQHRFRVVKIVSSEPFKRGRWVCMDFIDPPTVHTQDSSNVNNNNNNKNCEVPAIQVTPCNAQPHDHLNVENTVAHVFEIPVNQACSGRPQITIGGAQQNQQFYGIILPQHNQCPISNQFTFVQNIGIKTGDRNCNHLQEHQNQNSEHGVQNQNCEYGVQNQNCEHGVQNQPWVEVPPQNNAVPVSTVIVTSSSTSGNTGIPETAQVTVQSINGHEPDYTKPKQDESIHVTNTKNVSVRTNTVNVPQEKSARNNITEDSESCHTASEKVPVAEVGQDADTNVGSAASTGASTVAIDNKIEQAMDLVKSHLMFAVREEVEVLKEKITELLERISQLEHENDILRANASPETLKQLNQSQKKFSTQPAHASIGKQQKAPPPHLQAQPPAS